MDMKETKILRKQKHKHSSTPQIKSPNPDP